MRRSLRRRSRVPDGAEEKLSILERILLGNIDCSEFMDEKHCAYAKQILSKKLENLSEVWVSREYLIAVIRNIIFAEYYLLGRDSDSGLLFVNKVEIDNSRNISNKRKIAKTKNITVYAVRDDDVKRLLLGYDYDVNDSPYTINKPGAYRVQGDVVVRVQPIDQVIIDRVARHVALVASELAVVDFITAVLTEHDIGATTQVSRILSITPQTDRGVDIVVSIPASFDQGKNREFAIGIARFLADELGKYFGTHLTASKSDFAVVEEQSATEGRHGVLLVGPISNAVMIGVTGAPTPLMNRVKGIVQEALLSYLQGGKGNAVDTTLKVGRHLLTLRRVRSAMLALNTSQLVKLHYLEDRELVIHLADPPSYVVDENSEITFSHIQHREKTLRFSGEYVISITHTRTALDYTAEMNMITLSNLLSAVDGASSQASP